MFFISSSCTLMGLLVLTPMRIFLLILLVIIFQSSCSKCPPCAEESCEDTESSQNEEEDADSSDGEDIESTPIGSKPKEVSTYDLHGRAGFDRVSIWSKPDMNSPRLGYLRRGQRMMLGNPEYSTEGCPKGWFKLETGGYVCQGRGMLVGNKPRFIRNPPPLPLKDQLNPYSHGFIRRDMTPVYQRIPKKEQIWKPPTQYVPGKYQFSIKVEEQDEQLESAESDTDAILTKKVEIEVDQEGKIIFPEGIKFEKNEDGEYILPTGLTIPTQDIPHMDTESITAAKESEDENVVVGIDYKRYAKRKYRTVRDFYRRGFWISVGQYFRDDDTREFYYETIRGDYVPGNAVHMVTSPEFHGYRVFGDTPLPAVIVTANNAMFYQKRNNRFVVGAGRVERLNSYRVYEKEVLRGETYYQVEGGRWLRDSHVTAFTLREPPEGIQQGEKWILIDLSRQTLEAYEGTAPYFVTLISSGLPALESTITPKGNFSINFKHLTDNMTGSVGDGDEVYHVEDVPYAQYFHNNIAMHAAFWHSRYGSPRSQGCVNLSPADARYLFNWTGPKLPQDWHGIAATEDNPGTKVFVVGKTPK